MTMKTEKMSEKSMKDALRNFEIAPSPNVWDRISVSDITPVVKPRSLRPFWIGAAAVVVLTGILLWYFTGNEGARHFDDSAVIADATPIDHDIAESGMQNTPSDAAAESQKKTPEQPVSTSADLRDQGVALPLNEGTSPSVNPEKPMATAMKQSKPAVVAPAIKPITPGQNELPAQNNTTRTKVADSEKQQDNTSGDAPGDHKPALLEVFIPTAFTPDNDGVNDYFLPVIQNNAEVKEYRMQIYARNGILLFESVNQEVGWDGRYLGVPVDDPVCIYAISFRDLEGNPYIRKGTVTIIK
jgi:gliding motility-associated-like protein